MKFNRTWIGLTLGLACACGMLGTAYAFSALADDAGATSAFASGKHFWQRMRAGRGARQAAVLHFVDKLGLSDAQRGLALQEARAAQAIVEQARRDAARILVIAHDARKSGQTVDARAELKALRQRTQAQLEPLGRQVVGSLTAEQRQLIVDENARRGRTFDEARLVRRTASLLALPMTVALLEARMTR
jgi:hypothetical protein